MSGNHRIKKQIGWVITALGSVCALIALSAGILGIDSGDNWGPARRFLLLTGVVLLVVPHTSSIFRISARIINNASNALGIELSRYSQELWKTHSRSSESKGSTSIPSPGREMKINLTLFFFLIFGLVTYTWLISVGRWTDWTGSTNYYHLLADGFRSGQSSLAVEPPQDLLDLSDPYDVQAREGLNYLWDVSLFDGKYYLYWGPAPAALVLIIEMVMPWEIGDNVLVWMFAMGCVTLLLLLLRFLLVELLVDMPWWTFLPIALLTPLVNPLPWLMTRPAVYEAAITGGQFFFIGGVFWFLTAGYGRKSNSWRYFLAGVFWTLAVGSRATLSIPVITLVLVSILLNSRKRVESEQRLFNGWNQIAALLIPLVSGAFLLVFYNYDRFGSILELGHRYQLGRTNISVEYSGIFGLMNVPQNLFNYMLNGFRTISVFPYIKPTWGKYAIPMIRYSAPNNYHAEQVTGFFLTTPFLLFSIVPILAWLHCGWKNIGMETASPCEMFDRPSLRDLYAWLWIAGIFTFLPLLLLRVNSMRHEVDFVPMALLLAAIGYIWTFRRLSNYVWLKKIFIIVVWTLILLSSIVAILLAITGYNAVFESVNPQLFDKLVRFFTL